jgi:hypothetical protein
MTGTTETTTTDTTTEPVTEPVPEPIDYTTDLQAILVEMEKLNEAYSKELIRQKDERDALASEPPNTFESDLLKSMDQLQTTNDDMLLAMDPTQQMTFQTEQQAFQETQKEVFDTGLEFLIILIGLIIGFMVSRSFVKGLVPW